MGCHSNFKFQRGEKNVGGFEERNTSYQACTKWRAFARHYSVLTTTWSTTRCEDNLVVYH